jgi:O-antigen/teichoic acid export membrane protein
VPLLNEIHSSEKQESPQSNFKEQLLKASTNPIDVVIRHLLPEPIVRSTSILLLNGILTAVMGLVFFMIAARFYSSEEVGMATAIYSGVSMLAALSTLGLHLGILRFLPDANRRSTMINSVFTTIVFTGIVAALIFLLVLPLLSPEITEVLKDLAIGVAAVAFVVGMGLFSMHSNVFIALRKTKFVLAQQISLNLVRIPLVIAIASLGTAGLIIGWVVAVWMSIALASFLLIRALSGYVPTISLSRRILTDMARFSIGGYFAELLAAAPTYLLPIIILNTLGPQENAYFYIPFAAVSRGLFLAPYVFGITLLAEGSHSPERESRLVNMTLILSFAILAPIVFFFFIFGEWFLLLFGTEYSRNSLYTLWILASSCFPIALIEIYIAVKRIRMQVLSTVYAYLAIAVISLTVSYILLVRVGLVGASIGWIAGHGVVAVIAAGLLFRRPIVNQRLEEQSEPVKVKSL